MKKNSKMKWRKKKKLKMYMYPDPDHEFLKIPFFFLPQIFEKRR